MSFDKLLLILVTCMLTLPACSQIRTAGKSNQDVSVPNPVVQSKPILELVTTATGSTYPKEGPILQMRLFKDGTFEYDDFPDVDPPRVTSRNVIIERKTGKLSLEDVNTLMSYASATDFPRDGTQYASIREHFDTGWKTTIHIENDQGVKDIIANNIWDTQHVPELRSKYPKSLLDLIEQVEMMKGRAIGRESHQWLAKPKIAS